MARVTIEDCLDTVDNRFALSILASRRARQIASGSEAMVATDNKPNVTALREVAAGKVSFGTDVHKLLSTWKRFG